MAAVPTQSSFYRRSFQTLLLCVLGPLLGIALFLAPSDLAASVPSCFPRWFSERLSIPASLDAPPLIIRNTEYAVELLNPSEVPVYILSEGGMGVASSLIPLVTTSFQRIA